jgi:NAD+ kinase
MSSTTGSTPLSGSTVRRAAVLTHGRSEAIGPALERVEAAAHGAGVELVFPQDELSKHDIHEAPHELADADLVLVLGGDGTMLRALRRLLDTGIPAIGVNFGRVGFLTAIAESDLDAQLPRVFAGEYRVIELPTLELELDGERRAAVNDVVAASATVGRMVELSWTVGGEPLGRQACDGIICATPSGSTAYNLSNGGPVLVWGLDALAVTFIAPHSLHARSMVVPRGLDVVVTNESADVAATVLFDGRRLGEIPPAGRVVVRLGEQRTLLATLPEITFFHRYRNTFTA